MARILVTGVAGQIGSFLAKRLVCAGHDVVGVERPTSRRFRLPDAVEIRALDLNADHVERLLDNCGSLDAVVHLAGETSVAESWKAPLDTFRANATTAAALAYATQARNLTLVNASSAEIFGASAEPVQTESTRIAPVSPYGVAKAAGHLAVTFTRESLGARATNLIFFLGESTLRSPRFVFRKITRGLARVRLGMAQELSLGNTALVRDFCWADDFARAAEILALGAPPGDYICASGEAHTIQDVAETCCRVFDLEPEHVLKTDATLFRRADIPRLVGNASKLRALGWAPSKTFEELVRTIAAFDLEEARQRDV